MMALGHTGPELGRLLGGWSREHVHEVLKRQRVTRGTQAKFEALYDTVHMLPGASQRLRLLGEARGWVVPLAWDDITDLDETPTGVRPADAKGKKSAPTTRAGRAARAQNRERRSSREMLFEYNLIRESGMGHEFALKELGMAESAWYAAYQRVNGLEKR
jgi:hypothetical protein